MSDLISVRGRLCTLVEISARDRTREGSMDAFLSRLDKIVKGYQDAIGVQANDTADYYLTLTMDLPRPEEIGIPE